MFRRFLVRKKFILCVYSMSWIVAEKRYLSQLKRSEQDGSKDKLRHQGTREVLIDSTNTSVPLKVRLFYINEYYDMAR